MKITIETKNREIIYNGSFIINNKNRKKKRINFIHLFNRIVMYINELYWKIHYTFSFKIPYENEYYYVVKYPVEWHIRTENNVSIYANEFFNRCVTKWAKWKKNNPFCRRKVTRKQLIVLRDFIGNIILNHNKGYSERDRDGYESFIRDDYYKQYHEELNRLYTEFEEKYFGCNYQ